MNAYTDVELPRIARHQRGILRLFLVTIFMELTFMLPVPSRVAEIGGLFVLPIFLLIGIIGAVFVYRLAKALNHSPWLYLVAAFVPLFNLLSLLMINARATAASRAGGIKVGIMGAKDWRHEEDPRMARQKKILAWAGVFGFLAMAVWSISSARKEIQALTAVSSNLQIIDGAKQQWAIEKRKQPSAMPAPEDLTPFLNGKRFPEPVGEEVYNINAIGSPPTVRLNVRAGTIITNRGFH